MALDELTVSPPAPGPGPTRRRRWRRVVLILGVVLLMVAAGLVALAASLDRRYESAVQRANILEGVPRPVVVRDLSPKNYLLLGSDLGVDEGERSDTIMIVHLAQGHQRAFILSIPRDSYVYVPPAGSWRGGYNKINAAFAFGGANHAARTVYELTKIPFDGAFVMNFDGVHRMVGEMGGVTVCIPYEVRSIHTARVWEAGCHTMGPEETEDFVRQRKSVPGGDLGRIYDQHLVIQALAEKITDEGLLSNPLRLDRLILIAAQSVTADESVDLRRLILDVKDITPDNITYATAPMARFIETSAGSSIELDEAGSRALFQAVLDDTTDAWLATHPQGAPA